MLGRVSLLPSCSAGQLPTRCMDNQREFRGDSCTSQRQDARPLTNKESTAIPATDAPLRSYAESLDTPCVIVDLTLLERNIAEMAALAYKAQVALRPHVKTHKTPQIAAMQLDAGAVGLTCAKVGEAEVLADAGFTDLFVCFPKLCD